MNTLRALRYIAIHHFATAADRMTGRTIAVSAYTKKMLARTQAPYRAETHPGCFRGFSALELMVVLALIAIFTALALPSFQVALEHYRVNAAATEIANVLQFARSEAIRTRQVFDVEADTNCAGNGATDWSSGFQVCGPPNPNNPDVLKVFKTTSATDFAGVSVLTINTPPVAYSSLGFITGGSGAIEVWPKSDNSFTAASYYNIVCLSAGGNTHILLPPNTAEQC
jgi:type IV fimbrial biogenesis protein FimT